jgi:hypothetical protein
MQGKDIVMNVLKSMKQGRRKDINNMTIRERIVRTGDSILLMNGEK